MSRVSLRVPPRNRASSVLFVALGCLMAWSGIANLTNYYDGLRSTVNFVLGLAFVAVALQLLIDAVVYALPDSRRQAKLRLRVAVLSLAAIGLVLAIVSLVVRFSAS